MTTKPTPEWEMTKREWKKYVEGFEAINAEWSAYRELVDACEADTGSLADRERIYLAAKAYMPYIGEPEGPVHVPERQPRNRAEFDERMAREERR